MQTRTFKRQDQLSTRQLQQPLRHPGIARGRELRANDTPQPLFFLSSARRRIGMGNPPSNPSSVADHPVASARLWCCVSPARPRSPPHVAVAHEVVLGCVVAGCHNEKVWHKVAEDGLHDRLKGHLGDRWTSYAVIMLPSCLHMGKRGRCVPGEAFEQG
jgi:hypothetical protein